MSDEKFNCPTKFDHSELRQVIEKSKELIQRGYFTGINYLQSEKALPKSSVVVHFLHDSEMHLDAIKPFLDVDHSVVPRMTFYNIRPEYCEKPNFEEEYKNATFYDSDFNKISIKDVIRCPQDITVSNKELDLVFPVSENNVLEEVVARLVEADEKGPEHWVDPVIILKTDKKIKSINNFVDKHYVSVARKKEEFYSIMPDERRAQHLEIYFDKLCEKEKGGTIKRSDIVFSPSQINKEFSDYLNEIQKELNIFE